MISPKLGQSVRHTVLRGLRRSFSSGESEVLLESRGHVRLISLNRPKALNALNINMIRQIYPAMLDWPKEGAKLVIIKGVGGKAFCAGGDVRSLVEEGMAGNPDFAMTFFQEEYRLNHLIGTYPIPYVALIDGITMGGGVGLSVHGQFRVATEKTLFAMPEAAIGLFPDVGGGYFLPRLAGHLGMYLALSSYRLSGWDVLHSGVATHFCSSEFIPELEEALLEQPAASLCPKTISATLAHFQSQSGKPAEFSLAPHLEKMNALFDSDSVEGILEQLEKDGSEWATKTLAAMSKMAPTSLKLTFRQLVEGRQLSLGEVLRMENRMGCRVMETGGDFFEGVRAVLIDKTGKPNWKPASVNAVTAAFVDRHFDPLPKDRELILPEPLAKL